MEESDDLGALEAKRRYLEEWMERHKKAQEVLPLVQMNLDLTKWQITALSNRPEEASEIPFPGLTVQWNRDNENLQKALPLMPLYDSKIIVTSTAFSTSGSAVVYEYVSRVRDLGTPAAVAYSDEHTTSYRALQVSQERPKVVRQMLEKLRNAQTLDRFDRALKSYSAAKSGSGERTAAALEMRTFLDGIKGDLFVKARQRPNENMTWQKMVERLVTGGPSGAEFHLLLSQEAICASLINRLSQVAKDREGHSVTDLDGIWAQNLEYAYTVLGLIDFSK